MVEFLPANHAVHRINAEARAGLVRAQQAVVTREFPEAHSFCARVLDDLKLNLPLPDGLRDQSVTGIADLSFAELRDFWAGPVTAAGTPEDAAGLPCPQPSAALPARAGVR